jgi:hypothetical protein
MQFPLLQEMARLSLTFLSRDRYLSLLHLVRMIRFNCSLTQDVSSSKPLYGRQRNVVTRTLCFRRISQILYL